MKNVIIPKWVGPPLFAILVWRTRGIRFRPDGPFFILRILAQTPSCWSIVPRFVGPFLDLAN
jgi:hypothetical protein